MNKIFCPNCYAEYESDPGFCRCGYPFRGTEMEKYNFMSERVKKVHTINEGMETANYARIILFAIGGINLLAALYNAYIVGGDPLDTLFTLIYSGILIGLAFYSYQEPFFALLIGFLIMVLMYIVIGVMNPMLVLSGIPLKLIYTAGFVYGLVKIKKGEDLMNHKS
ncbi:MAG: hypothetical protein HC830_06665 [Bacteroidetes bacterium]|nr:hypothetical protein [Bacteroidota bacterium]